MGHPLIVALAVLGLGAGGAPPAGAIDIVACDTPSLVKAISDANAKGGFTKLWLAEGCTYTLTAPASVGEHGPNGLPIVTGQIDFQVARAVITRAPTAPRFRIFEIARGGAVAITGSGRISGGHTPDGAPGQPGGDGGGVYNAGSFAMSLYSGVMYNQTGAGGDGGPAAPGGRGGRGGGIFNDGGSVAFAKASVSNNATGKGGDGSVGGVGGDGGGIASVGGTIRSHLGYVEHNTTGAAGNGPGGRGGRGGGIATSGSYEPTASTVGDNVTGAGGPLGRSGDGGGLALLWAGSSAPAAHYTADQTRVSGNSTGPAASDAQRGPGGGLYVEWNSTAPVPITLNNGSGVVGNKPVDCAPVVVPGCGP